MSPRPGPVRPIVGVRLGASELAAIDKRAKKAKVTRSEMIRRLLAQALFRDFS